MKQNLSMAALGLAAALTLSACTNGAGNDTSTDTSTDTGSTTSPSAPTSTGTSSVPAPTSTGTSSVPAPTSTSTVSEEHNQADVMFSRMMIPHHEQAVEMSDLMLAKDGISPEISDLATRIKDAQEPEIVIMEGFLETWGAVSPDSVKSHDVGGRGGTGDGDGMGSGEGMGDGSGPTGGMAGMLSEDEMSELERAEGTEASRLFLESMTVHHEGAIEMAQEAIENGENPDAIKLAEDIVTTQQAEIEEMRELLASL